jgi:hypothetical protein
MREEVISKVEAEGHREGILWRIKYVNQGQGAWGIWRLASNQYD